mmetsp:Transcript_17053/g.22183  ORF Transcript_17053/g.22183 Transcript_17053/m.22183 type:complete len:210 (+) Transcript_17053:732-1361(+)
MALEDQLFSLEDLRWDLVWDFPSKGSFCKRGKVLVPLLDKGNLKEAQEIISIGGSDPTSRTTFQLDLVRGWVRSQEADIGVIIERAELFGDTSDWVRVFQISIRLEVCTRHGRSNQTDWLNFSFTINLSCQAALDFNFINSELQEAGSVFANDVCLDEAAELFNQFLDRFAFDGWKDIHKQAGRSCWGNLRVHESALNFVQSLDKDVFS